MRISDWSSDVCSSDLTVAEATGVATDLVRGLRVLKGIGAEPVAGARYRVLSGRARDASVRSTSTYGAMAGLTEGLAGLFLAAVALVAGHRALSGDITIGEIGRASCRERVCQYV